MTPATSSQMSRSSSTIKISSAMIFSVLSVPHTSRNRFCLPHAAIPALTDQRPQAVGVQGQRNARPLPRRIIGKFQFAIMLLDDLLDDREADTRSALPCRHIGFGDGIARFGQAEDR